MIHRFGFGLTVCLGLLLAIILPAKITLADYYGVELAMQPSQTTVQQGQDVTITFTANVGSGLQVGQASTAFIVAPQYLKLISIDNSSSSFDQSVQEGVLPGVWYSNESQQPYCFVIDRSSSIPLTGSLTLASATFQVLAPPGLMPEVMYDQSCSTFRNATTPGDSELAINATASAPNTAFNLTVTPATTTTSPSVPSSTSTPSSQNAQAKTSTVTPRTTTMGKPSVGVAQTSPSTVTEDSPQTASPVKPQDNKKAVETVLVSKNTSAKGQTRTYWLLCAILVAICTASFLLNRNLRSRILTVKLLKIK